MDPNPGTSSLPHLWRRSPGRTGGGWRLRIPLWIGGLLLLPLSAAAQGSPVVAAPVVAGGTDSFFHFDLANGTGYLSDRLRDPLQIRVRVITQNLFGVIGRPTSQAAVPGEIHLEPIFVGSSRTGAALFVEASTGYVALFDEFGRNDRLGEILVAVGRPFAPIASRDGNHLLLMRRDGSGRTEGAYLYHATSGRALYVDRVREIGTDVPVTTIRDLPQLTGRAAAAAVQSGRRETWSYLVFDGGSGEMYFFDLDRRQSSRVVARKSARVLTEVLPAERGAQAAVQRFVAEPVLAADDRTQYVFVLDVTTGDMALVEDVDGSQPGLRKASLNLYTAGGLTIGTEPRHWTAVSNLASSGETLGIWLRDSLTSRWFYLDNPAAPREMTVRQVAAGG